MSLTFDGNVRVSFLTTLTSLTSPSAAEITAGTALEGYITPDGWSPGGDTASVDQSNLGSTFTNEAAGRRSFAPTITYKRYDDSGTATAAETTLVYRANGFLVVRSNKAATSAFASGDKVDIYPVQCGQPVPANAAPNETQKATVRLFMSADAHLAVTAAA